MLAALTLGLSLSWALEFDANHAGPIAKSVGNLLEEYHYRKSPLDDSVSTIFLKNYLDALDYNHDVLLQSDVDELKAAYESKLDDMVQQGDISAADIIFQRYLQRREQRQQLVTKLLKENF